MRTLRHGFSNRARGAALALFVVAAGAAGILSAGCETDDSSTPLPPAAKDATTDQASTDGSGGGEAAPTPEAGTETSTEASARDGEGTDGAAD